MKIQIDRCPFCGYGEFIEATHCGVEANVSGGAMFGQELKHLICRHCGSVVRSYVEEPEKLLKKKDRREE
jgi:ribosomal protein L37E